MVDYYGLEELLTEEERMSRDLARELVDKEVIPIIARHYREGTFPLHLVGRMGELGFLGANLSKDVSPIALGLVMQELERGDSGIRSFVSVQNLGMFAISTFSSEPQKTRWLPALASGERIVCFALTEPDHGSDPASMKTRAVRTQRGYLLNGTKLWITSGSIADVAIVWAKLEGHVRGFLVEKGTPGFHARDIKGKLSQRASVTSELSFQECELPEESLLAKTRGLKSTLACLTEGRYGIAWGAVGAAQACYETALDYAKSRIQFGRPIASFQLIQDKLVFMLTEITKAQLLCHRLGQLKAQGKATPAQMSLAKRNNVRMALEIARLAREILAANGIVDEYPVMRHMCNLEATYTLEGTHHIQTLVVGRDITGLDAIR